MAEIVYTPRLTGPYLVERGRTQTITLPVYSGSSLVSPTIGTSTCTLTDPAGRVVSSGVPALVSSVAEYAILGTATAAEAVGDRWLVTWSLTMPDGVQHVYRQPAALCLVVPAPAATLVDLYQRAPALDPAGPAPISGATSWQAQLDEAWAQIQDALISKKMRPWLIIGSSDLRRAHLALALALAFEALASRNNPAFLESSKQYRLEYKDAWAEMTFSYSSSDSGLISPDRARSGALWLGPRRGTSYLGVR